MTDPVTKVALTGATGFIGAWTVRALQEAGIAIRALTRRSAPPAPGVEWVRGDLDDRSALVDLATGVQAVVHVAGAVRGRTRADFDAVNVAGAEKVAHAFLTGSPEGRFLLISSLAAREPGLSHYAASKRLAEERLAALLGDRLTVLRPPAVYGPGDRELAPLLTAMARGLAAAPVHEGRIALIYVEDLAAAVLAWLRCGAAGGGVFELHDGHPEGGYSWEELRGVMASLTGRRVRLLRVPQGLLAAIAAANVGLARLTGHAPMLSPGKVRDLYHPDWRASNEALARATGWQPVVDLGEGLRRTLELD